MAITFNMIDDKVKLEMVDIITKREAIEGALADIQTERAKFESDMAIREQELMAEKNKLTEEIRINRKATVEGLVVDNKSPKSI